MSKLKSAYKDVTRDLAEIVQQLQKDKLPHEDADAYAVLGLCYARMTLEEAQETCERLRLMTNAGTTDDERQGN